MVEQDLLLFKLIGYTLGSSYSCQIFRKEESVFLLEKIYAMIELMCLVTVKKKILKLALFN
jgi:hypothetical protein